MAKLFKTTAFRCISILLIIALISGGLLAILNDLLFVPSWMRTSRAISKIYGEEKDLSMIVTILDIDNNDDAIEYEFGKINKIYQVGDDYLFQTTGYNGYKNGTITVWVQVSVTESTQVIEKVILESYEKQTLMSKLGDAFYNGYNKDITDTYFTTDNGNKNVVTGATKSATAGNNAVNCVIEYFKGNNNEN